MTSTATVVQRALGYGLGIHPYNILRNGQTPPAQTTPGGPITLLPTPAAPTADTVPTSAAPGALSLGQDTRATQQSRSLRLRLAQSKADAASERANLEAQLRRQLAGEGGSSGGSVSRGILGAISTVVRRGPPIVTAALIAKQFLETVFGGDSDTVAFAPGPDGPTGVVRARDGV